MKTDALKSELIDWLMKLEDKSLLASLFQLKVASDKGDWSNDLSPKQVESLQRGLSDLKKNNTIPSREFWKNYGKNV